MPSDLPANCPIELVVVAGQSNALGYTVHRRDAPARLQPPMERVFIWAPSSQDFAPLTAGVNTGTPNNPDSWGPEAQYAYRWQAEHRCGRLYIVKQARGETGLALDAAERDWSPASGEELWARATTEITAAKARLARSGVEPTVSKVLWMQGETDAQLPAKARAYARNLTTFIGKARAHWGSPSTGFVIGQIDAAGTEGAKTVRAAQAEVAEDLPAVSIVDTDPFPRQPADGVHLTAAGQVALGDAFYEAPPD